MLEGIFVNMFAQLFMLILPWLTLFFMKKQAIKRYMPVAILMSLIMTIIYEIAYTYEWWIINEHIIPWGYITDISFVYGLFAVGTMWIFYLTFQLLWLYVVTTLSFDFFMAYIGFKFLEELGIITVKNIIEWQFFLVIFFVAILLYSYQLWQEKIFTK